MEEGRQRWIEKGVQQLICAISPSPSPINLARRKRIFSSFSFSTQTPTRPLIGPRLTRTLIICCECSYKTPTNTAAVCLGPPGIIESKDYIASCHHRFCRNCWRIVLKRYWTCGGCEKVNLATEGYEACKWCGSPQDRSYELWWGVEGTRRKVMEVVESF